MICQYDCREIHFLYFLKQKMTKGIACYDQHEFFIIKLHGLVLTIFENLRIESLTLKNSRANARESVFVNDQYFFHEKRRITDILRNRLWKLSYLELLYKANHSITYSFNSNDYTKYNHFITLRIRIIAETFTHIL